MGHNRYSLLCSLWFGTLSPAAKLMAESQTTVEPQVNLFTSGSAARHTVR